MIRPAFVKIAALVALFGVVSLALCPLLISKAFGAATYYFQKPDMAAPIPDNARVLIYDANTNSDKNVTGATLKGLASGKLDAAKFSGYSASRQTEINVRLPIVRYSNFSSVTQGKLDAKSNTVHGHAATEISYTNPTYTTVAAALNQLLYVAPGSPSVSGGGTYETGQTITSVVLNWTIALGSAALTSQSIDNGIGSISPALRTYTHSGQSITANRTYTVSITDGTTPRTGSTTVSFSRYRHWGASTIPLASFTSANILALGSSEFSTSHSKSTTYDCTGGRYPTFAFVSTAGLLTATTVGGLSFSDYSYRTISHTNASGSVTNYYVYQFNNIQTGAAVAVVWD